MRCIIENITSDRISGWALNDQNPNQKLAIFLIKEDGIIDAVSATNHRADLLKNNVGDGNFGFIIPTQGIDYYNSIINGDFKVLAGTSISNTIEASIVNNLHKDRQKRMIFETIGSLNIDDFVLNIEKTSNNNPDLKKLCIDSLNASRAHYTDWWEHKEFHRIAEKFSRELNLTNTNKFYSDRIRNNFQNPADSPSSESWPTISIQAKKLAYGNFEVDNSIELSFSPIKFTNSEKNTSPSFLVESEIFTENTPNDSRNKINFFAYREYCFGEPTWFVMQKDIKIKVMRNIYYFDFEKILESVSGNNILCIDMSNEGPVYTEAWNAVANKAVMDLGLNKNHILYITQNLNYLENNKSKNHFFGGIAFAHYFIKAALKNLASMYPDEKSLGAYINEIFEARQRISSSNGKHFICLNFTPRKHRLIFALFLNKANLLDKGFISFPGEKNSKFNDEIEDSYFSTPFAKELNLRATLDDFIKKCPLVLDISQDGKDHVPAPVFDFPVTHMKNSLIHIVTESEMSDKCVRITEKILKPIIGLQPFILLGNALSLNLLRNLGFKTFPDLFNEEYDQISDPDERLRFVSKEITRLCEMKLEDLKEKVNKTNAITEYNLRHLIDNGEKIFGHDTAKSISETAQAMLNKIRS
jgi:hypothetical protein